MYNCQERKGDTYQVSCVELIDGSFEALNNWKFLSDQKSGTMQLPHMICLLPEGLVVYERIWKSVGWYHQHRSGQDKKFG